MVVKRLSFKERGGWWLVAQIPALTVAALLPPWSSPVTGLPESPLQWFGVILFALGAVLTVAAAVGLARRSALTPFPHPTTRARLAANGAYGFMRHPIYAGILLAALGWAVSWLSPWGVAYAVGLAVFLDRKAAREERWLRQRFPDYADYARRVRRFIPGIY